MVVSRRRNLAHYKKKKEGRLGLLESFPLNTPVVWVYAPETVLTVTGHDNKNGRIETSNGRSYVPGELEVRTKND